MRKNLLIHLMLTCSIALFAKEIPVTTLNYVDEYSKASNGDVLLLDSGTYTTTLAFPIDKSIIFRKSPKTIKMPVFTFAFDAVTTIPTTGSSLTLDSIDINYNANYYLDFGKKSAVDKLIFKNCLIRNIKRCLVKATLDSASINELSLERNIIKDCGLSGYCLVWSRIKIMNMNVKFNTMYKYGGEGFFIAQTTNQTHNFVFNMQNNTIYKSGKDGLASYAWCSIGVAYAPTSTYNISNNIFCRPFTTAASRTTIFVPEGSGIVTCKNNLTIDYSNFTTAPAAGWDTSNLYVSSKYWFKDTANFDFTLPANFTYKGTDNLIIGDPRWLPKNNVSVSKLKTTEMEVYPTLTSNIVNIKSESLIYTIKVINIEGRLVASFEPNKLASVINVSTLQNGYYILIIKTPNGISAKKIQVQK